MALALAVFLAEPALAEKVTFQTPDGFQIVGEFAKPASSGHFTFILLHGVGSGKQEWKPFAELLASKGYGVLRYDARGHEESAKRKSGEIVTYETFFGRGMQSDWGRMVDDLASAVKMLKDRFAIEPKTVALCGASIGANVALRYAADYKDVSLLILLSPGVDYQGITANDVIGRYGSRPLAMAACPTDGYAYQSVMVLQNALLASKAKDAGAPAAFIEPPGAGHGVQMFRRADPLKPSGLEEKLLHWIQSQKVQRK